MRKKDYNNKNTTLNCREEDEEKKNDEEKHILTDLHTFTYKYYVTELPTVCVHIRYSVVTNTQQHL